jgi:acyl-CoA thioesterase-1
MVLLLAALALFLQSEPRQPVIVTIGDSMTAGYGVAPEWTYPAQLEKEVNRRGYPYRVLNQGVTASTSTQVRSRLTRALATGPHIVIIQFGGNDASQGIPQSISRDNLRMIVDRFKPGGARLFFAGGRFPYMDNLAKELNIPVIPFLEGVSGHRDLLLDDGIHPNAEGYAVVVENILKTLEPAMKEMSKEKKN